MKKRKISELRKEFWKENRKKIIPMIFFTLGAIYFAWLFFGSLNIQATWTQGTTFFKILNIVAFLGVIAFGGYVGIYFLYLLIYTKEEIERNKKRKSKLKS